MAGARGRGLRPGGVVRALARLVVLVAVGFGVGLVFGVVLEEPELLAAHLVGESESVELVGDAPGDVPNREPLADTADASDRADAVIAAARPRPSPEERGVETGLPGVAASRSGDVEAMRAPERPSGGASARFSLFFTAVLSVLRKAVIL